MNNQLIAGMIAVASTAAVALPVSANTGLLLQDLDDFSSNASYSQGSDGHVIIDELNTTALVLPGIEVESTAPEQRPAIVNPAHLWH